MNKQYINYNQIFLDNEKRKKDKIFNSNGFKILKSNNEEAFKIIVNQLFRLESREILDLIEYLINLKSVQKQYFKIY
jgi:hypothetical protein